MEESASGEKTARPRILFKRLLANSCVGRGEPINMDEIRVNTREGPENLKGE